MPKSLKDYKSDVKEMIKITRDNYDDLETTIADLAQINKQADVDNSELARAIAALYEGSEKIKKALDSMSKFVR